MLDEAVEEAVTEVLDEAVAEGVELRAAEPEDGAEVSAEVYGIRKKLSGQKRVGAVLSLTYPLKRELVLT